MEKLKSYTSYIKKILIKSIENINFINYNKIVYSYFILLFIHNTILYL